jgi:hypothetical protein
VSFGQRWAARLRRGDEAPDSAEKPPEVEELLASLVGYVRALHEYVLTLIRTDEGVNTKPGGRYIAAYTASVAS